MKNIIKKTLVMASVLGAAAILTGCGGCPNAKQHHKHRPMPQQTTETVVFYQTYEEADIAKVKAKMYTRSSHGGESKMGYIKFAETDAGLKMYINLKDLRPGVSYTAKLYQCGSCNNNSMCCDKSPMNVNLPTIRIDHTGTLEESFIIRGLTAEQLNNAKIYLERDGGYKAAWGTLNGMSM